MGLSDFFTFGVDVAFDAGPFTASPTWTDVTDDVLAGEGITFSRGTRTVGSRVGPGLADLTMRNWSEGAKVAGRWTPGVAASPWHPLALKRRLRIKAIPSSVGVRTNLAKYPSAESGTTGWGINSNATIGTTSAWSASGANAWTITSVASGNASIRATTRSDVTEGVTYTVSATFRATTVARSVRVLVVWYDAGASVISTTSGASFTSSTSADVVAHVTATAPAGAVTAAPLLAVYSTAAGGEVHYADALLVEESPTVGAYFDGSTAGYEWTGTAHASTSRTVTYPLWSGHITDHTPGWVGAGQSTCGLSCSDILAALARVKPFPTGAVLAEQLYDAPVLAYPLDEDEFATTAGDRSPTPGPVLSVAQFGTGGALDFGGGQFGPEGDTCAVFTRVDGSNGKYLTADIGSLDLDPADPCITVVAFVKPGAVSEYLGLLNLQTADTNSWVGLATTAGGSTAVRGGNPAGMSTAGTGAALLPDTWHQVVLQLQASGATTTASYYVDAALQGYTLIDLDPRTLTTLWVGRDRNVNSTFDGQVAAVAVYPRLLSGARVTQQNLARDGWAGELAGARFQRLARLAGTTYAVASSAGASTLGAQQIKGKQITAALNEVADSDRGSVNVDRDGVLRYSGRETRRGVGASVTLDARTDILNRLDGLAYNDDGLVNDVTVTRAGGATVRAANQRSVDDFGSMTDSADVILNADADAQDLAEWKANVNARPAIKAPTLRVSMLNIATRSPSQTAAMLALDLGQRVTVTNLPAGLPSTTLDLFVEGIDDEIGPNDWVRTITTSNIARGGAVWVLGDPTYSVLGSTTILA